MSGYIKLHRSVRSTEIASNPEYFAAWVHLLCMATHTHHKAVVGNTVVNLKPGQLIFGRVKFSAMTGISENKIRSAISVMKSLSMITSKSHAKFSVITITKWSEYQGDHQQTTSKPPANHQQTTTYKKGVRREEEGIKKNTGADALDYASWPEAPSDQILKDWIAARKKAKATHSQTAINTIGKQLHQARAMGFSVDDCLSEAVVKGWRGFKAEWMRSSGPAAQHATSPMHRAAMPKPNRPNRSQ